MRCTPSAPERVEQMTKAQLGAVALVQGERTFPSFVNDALVLLDDKELGRALALELKSGEYTLVLQDGAIKA